MNEFQTKAIAYVRSSHLNPLSWYMTSPLSVSDIFQLLLVEASAEILT